MCNGRQQKNVEERICCNFVVSEETYVLTTGFYGTCKRGSKRHSFQIALKMISACTRENVHKNSRSIFFSSKLSSLCSNTSDRIQIF